MLRALWDRTAAFDAEWVPCAETGRRLLGLGEDVADADVFRALWDFYRRDGDDSDARPFLKLVMSRVISIAAVFRTVQSGRTALQLLSVGVHGSVTEGVMIQRFLERVATDNRQLWGFNSRGADVPILVQRAVVLEASLPNFASVSQRNRDYFYRYGDSHMDILDAVQGFGGSARMSLQELAVACRIPGKLDTSGGDVAQLYLDGKLQQIVDYNETDALTTHLLMLRTAYTAGKLTREQYDAEQAAVLQLLEEEIGLGKGHLARFRDAWQRA